jgi:hypothetical protein
MIGTGAPIAAWIPWAYSAALALFLAYGILRGRTPDRTDKDDRHDH